MARQRKLLVPILTVLLLRLLEPVSSVSISAWYAKGLDAPQIVMYDPKSGKMYYSLCNSKETPVFPYDDSTTLKLMQKPFENTTVTGSAGYEGTALIHYQEEGGGIVQAIFKCDEKTGHWNMEPGQSWIVTAGAPVISSRAIKNGTDLTVLTLNTNGHRVFYKDWENRPALLEYRVGPKGREGEGYWAYGGLVSQDKETASTIGAAFVGNGDMTVVMATNANDTFQMMAKKLDDKEWTLSSYPLGLSDGENSTTLPKNTTSMEDFYWYNSVNGQGQLEGLSNESDIGIGYLRDSKGVFEANIFYVGTDSRLHQQIGTLYNPFKTGARQNISVWPTADEPNTRIGLASFTDTGDLWVYYMSDGNMTQVYMKNKEWQTYKILEKVAPELPADSDDSGSQAGLSQSQKIGIGVGVGLGVPLIIALTLYYFFVFTKKSRAQKEQEKTVGHGEGAGTTSQEAKADPSSTDTKNIAPPNVGSPAPRYTSGHWGDAPGQWVDGQWVPSPHAGADPSGNQWAHWQQNGQHSNAPASRISEMSAISSVHGQGTGNSNRISEMFAQQPIYEMPQQDREPQELATQHHQRDQTWEMGTDDTRLRHNVSPPPAAGSPPPPQAVSPMPTGSSTVGVETAAPSEVHEKSA